MKLRNKEKGVSVRGRISYLLFVPRENKHKQAGKAKDQRHFLRHRLPLMHSHPLPSLPFPRNFYLLSPTLLYFRWTLFGGNWKHLNIPSWRFSNWFQSSNVTLQGLFFFFPSLLVPDTLMSHLSFLINYLFNSFFVLQWDFILNPFSIMMRVHT